MNELDKASAALLEAQKTIGKVVKNKENPFFNGAKYADYEAVLDVVKKPLNDNGFVIVHAGVSENGKEYLKTTLLHTSGGLFTSQFPVLIDGNAQHMGSSISYCKRYNLASLTGISSEEDDDGNGAAKATTSAQPAKTSPNTQKPPSLPSNTASLGGGLHVAVFMPSAVVIKQTKAGNSYGIIKDGETGFAAFEKKDYELAQQALSVGKAIKMAYSDDGKYKTVKSVMFAAVDPVDAVIAAAEKMEEIPW